MNQPWRRSGARLLFSVGAGAIGLLLLDATVPRMSSLVSGFPYDFIVELVTARGYLDHVNPFTDAGARALQLPQRFGDSGTGHPPSTSFWALPLARLTPSAANAVVGWITVLLLLVEMIGTFTSLGWPAVLPASWLAFTYVLSCSFMQVHLAAGQLSGAIGFLYFVSWRAGRRGDELLSGTALGLACTMKLFPGAVALLLVARRRWTALISAAVAYLAIAAVMTSRFGLSSWPFFLRKQSAIASIWMASIQNQSIHGVVLRMFRPACEARHGLVPAATFVATGISVGLLALAVRWTSRRRGAGRGGAEEADVSFALFVVLSIITSPWSWEHYTVIYVLPAAILLDRLARSLAAGDHRVRTKVMLLLVIAVIATWQIDLGIKLRLGRSVVGGHREDHVALHVFEVLSWAPGYLLALLLFWLARVDYLRRLAHASNPT